MSRPYVESVGGAFIIGSRRDPETGERGELIQTDYGFPAAAERCGWNLRRVQKDSTGETIARDRAPARGKGCAHSSTDGTVDCRECGITAGEFIAAAADYLNSLC